MSYLLAESKNGPRVNDGRVWFPNKRSLQAYLEDHPKGEYMVGTSIAKLKPYQHGGFDFVPVVIKKSNAAIVPMAKGRYALVDPQDYHLVSPYKWNPCKPTTVWYAHGWTKGGKRRRHLVMHTLLMPDLELIDHVNGNGLDNRRSNLRAATCQQNCANRKKSSTPSRSPFKGVSWCSGPTYKKRWLASIYVKGKRILLGNHMTDLEAARAYDAAARKYYGEFARPNFAA